jgi:Flp pilus assembly pilin Flp
MDQRTEHAVGSRSVSVAAFLRDESGQAATEYVLVIGLISIPIFVAFETLIKKFLQEFIASVINTFTRG